MELQTPYSHAQQSCVSGTALALARKEHIFCYLRGDAVVLMLLQRSEIALYVFGEPWKV